MEAIRVVSTSKNSDPKPISHPRRNWRNGIVYPMIRILDLGSQGREVRMAPLSTTPTEGVGKFLFIFPVTLRFASLKVLVPDGNVLPLKDNISILLNWKLRHFPDHFELLMSWSQWARERISVGRGSWFRPPRGNWICFSTMKVSKIVSGVQIF